MSGDAPLPSSFDGNADFYNENRAEKFFRRLREEPLIPLGCALTVAALVGATRAIRAGDGNRTNIMFRRRIYAQGFTIVAMLAGSMYWQEDRNKRKEFEGVVAEKTRQEKRDKWIRELEVRDEEEKAMKAQLAQRRARREGRDALGAVKEKVESATEGVKEVVDEGVAKGEKLMEDGKEKVESKENKGILQSVKDLVGGK